MSEQTKSWIWIILIIFVLYKCSNSNDNNHSPTSSQYDHPRSSYDEDSSSFEDDYENRQDLTGDFDCSATNLSSGNGPYSLDCEQDGDDIIINFPNGGHITVDEDGFHSETGDIWEIEHE